MNLRQIAGKIGLAFAVFCIVSPAILFFLWMLSLSVKFEIDNAAYPPVFIPDRISWDNYVQVLTSNRFATYFFNTLIVTGSAIALVFFVLIVMLAAVMLYFRQRFHWNETGGSA